MRRIPQVRLAMPTRGAVTDRTPIYSAVTKKFRTRCRWRHTLFCRCQVLTGKGADDRRFHAGHERDFQAPFLFGFRKPVRLPHSGSHRHVNREESGGRRRGEQQQKQRVAEGTHVPGT